MAPFSRAERLFREASGRVEEPGGGSAEGREGDAAGERAPAAALPNRAALEAPPPVRWIVRTLEEAGYETWTVGGAVRDALLGRPGGDWDLATLARPQDVRRIFPRTVPIGVEHGTVGVLDRAGELHEVTTFRRDVETFGRRAVVEFAGTIEEDLARRDFTINALAWHPIRGELRDPFDGAADLRRRVLRTVGEPADRFAEDHLRVLRGLRFAGRFELRIEAGTWSALCAGTAWLRRLSAERIREELTKILEGDERPSRALGLYAASGAVGELYPELEPTIDAAPATEEGAGPAGAGQGIWENALFAVDVLPAGRPLLRLTALLARTGESERVPGHDDGDLPEVERAARRSAAVMTRLRFSNADVDRVTRLVRAGTVPPDPGSPPEARRRWLSRHGPDLLPDLGRIWVARARVERCRGRSEAAERVVAAWRGLRTELRRNPPLTEADLALDGRDLIRMGLDPGPRFGEILEHLLDRVLKDPACNRKETLQRIVEERLGDDPEGDVGEGGA